MFNTKLFYIIQIRLVYTDKLFVNIQYIPGLESYQDTLSMAETMSIIGGFYVVPGAFFQEYECVESNIFSEVFPDVFECLPF